MLSFLLDENLRGPLWSAIQRHHGKGRLPLNVVRVGDFLDLPLGSEDSAILAWAGREGRILISEDFHTMPNHLAKHLQTNLTSPGILMLRPGRSLAEVLDLLELIAHAGLAADYENLITFVP